MSTAEACRVRRGAKAVAAPEKIFDAVDSWAWVEPDDGFHFMAARRCQSVACW